MSEQEKPHRTSVIRQEEQQESERERPQEKQQIQLQQIMHQINPQQHPSPQTQPKITHLEPLVVKNPLYYYKGHQKYNWRLEQLDPNAILEQLQAEPSQYCQELPFQNEIEVSITQTAMINKHIGYTVKKMDRNGESTFTRRYTQYIAFRKKLVQLWPALLIPTLPNKTLLGSSDEQTIRSRIKYILHFWRKLTCYQKVYYSEQVKLFMNDQVNIQATLQKIQPNNISELFQKYKNAFPQAYQNCHRQEFMYKKDQAPLLFQEFQQYFTKKKIELIQYKDAFIKLADLKTKYIKAVSKLNQTLLPSYENVLFSWFNGTPIEDKPQKAERKSQDKQKSKERRPSVSQPKQGQTQAESQPQAKEQSQQPSQQSKQVNNSEVPFPHLLYGSQAYKSKLEDTAFLIQNYNSSVWVIYDVLKFQLKDIDAVLSILDHVRSVQKQIDYLKRGIGVNKQQIEALNNKKLTLKTFFMGGSQDDKKNKLTTEIQQFQQKLQKNLQFYHLLLALVQQQLITYHQQRINTILKQQRNQLLINQLLLGLSWISIYININFFLRNALAKLNQIIKNLHCRPKVKQRSNDIQLLYLYLIVIQEELGVEGQGLGVNPLELLLHQIAQIFDQGGMSQQVKIYIRNSKKYGKILNVTSQISGRQLYQLAAASQNLSAEQINLIYGGKTLSIQTELISLKQKAIVHLINLNEVNSPSIQLNIRTLFSNNNPITIQTNSNTTIKDFIDVELFKIYGYQSDKLLLVHIGRQLNGSKTFQQELIQNGSQLILANIQEIKNRKQSTQTNKDREQANLSLPIRDLEVPEQPKDIYVQPNFPITVPHQVNANNHLQLIFDSKVRHATSLPNCQLQPEEIIPEEDLNTKFSEDIKEENQNQKGESNQEQEEEVVVTNQEEEVAVVESSPTQQLQTDPITQTQSNQLQYQAQVQSTQTNLLVDIPLTITQGPKVQICTRQVHYYQKPQTNEFQNKQQQNQPVQGTNHQTYFDMGLM